MKLAGIIAGTIFVIAGFAYFLSSGDGLRTVTAEGYEELAQCITDSDAKFYAAFWCPYCQEQKRVFGRGADYLPYIECSTPDSRNQLQRCVDAGVTDYPTWEFADGVRLTGALSPRSLAQLTGCPYPGDLVDSGTDLDPDLGPLTSPADIDDVDVEDVEVDVTPASDEEN